VTKSFEGLKSAADVAKQIITLSTGVIAVTLAFFDKIQGDTPSSLVHGLIVASWIVFVLTILAAIVTLQGVTTSLDYLDRIENGEVHPAPAHTPGAYDDEVKGPAIAMIILFVLALALTAIAGAVRAPPAPPANTQSAAANGSK
jgi:hypothetical protein